MQEVRRGGRRGVCEERQQGQIREAPTEHRRSPKEGARPEVFAFQHEVSGQKRRLEFGAVEKIEMLKKVNSIELSIADQLSRQPKEIQEMEARKFVRKEMPSLWSKKKIDALKAQGPELKRIIFEKRLNKSLGRSRPAQLEYWYVSSGVGVRSKGAGRRNKFKTIWKHVQIWHTCQRLMGMQVDTQDIWLQFKDLAEKEIEVLQHLEDKDALPADRKVYKTELKDRLEKLESNPKYMTVYIYRIMKFAGMQVGRPSRYTTMTLAQEKIGWQISMRSWDHAVWLAGLGTADQLRGHVALPAQFIDHRKEVALVMTDQVPVWLKIGQRKIVFAKHEVVKNSRNSNKFKEGASYIAKVTDMQQTQKLPQIVEDLAQQQAEEAMTQKRSGAHGGSGADEKFRVTLECRHAVLGFFAGEPISVQLPPLLIMYGVHCRLSNISKDRRWIEDEEFMIADQVWVWSSPCF